VKTRAEDVFLVACKHVPYGEVQRTRLMSLARSGNVGRVALLLQVGANKEARDAAGDTPLLLA
jgi:ankyrin repeat protein